MQPLEPRIMLSNYYVALTGNDSNPGTLSAPWSSLQHAADSVGPDDTVLISAGSYAGFCDQIVATSGHKTTFKPLDGAAVTIDAPGPENTDGALVMYLNAAHQWLDNVTVKGGDANGIEVIDSYGIYFQNLMVESNAGSGLYAVDSVHTTSLQSCWENNGGNGILALGIGAPNNKLESVYNTLTVRDGMISGNRGYGCYLDQGALDCLLSGVTFQNNTQYDLYQGEATGTVVTDCTFADIQQSQCT
jgi:hypothetical protein